jgi:Xaa-Pro aminopeptidase
LAQGLIELGIIKSSLEDALAPEGDLSQWYMHNTGHWIGMDVHDVGIYRPNGKPRLFVAGMVITVEPGLYFGAWRPDVEIDQRWAGIGIRIEDDVLITDAEPDVLSSFCPKNPDELEAIIGTG